MAKLKIISRVQETFENSFRDQIRNFQTKFPDVEVELTVLPIHDHFTKMITEKGCLSDEFDLFLCCTDWLPEIIARSELTDLGPYVAQNPPAGYPDAYHPAMLKLQVIGDHIFGLPWHDGPEVLHYRRDLFEDPQEQAVFKSAHGRDLTPPNNWDEFLEVAKFFTSPEQGLWGCAQAGFTDGHNNVYDFLIQLWSRGGVLLDEDNKPQFNSSIGQEALKFYYDLFHTHKVASLECLDLGSVECGDYYAQGNAAMSWNWCGFAAIAEMPEYSKIVGKNKCAPIPGGMGPAGSRVSLNIYWVLTIPVGSKQKDLAYSFLQHIAADETDLMTSMNGANGVRLATWRNPDVRVKYPYYEIIESVHAGSKTMPAIPEYPAINEVISHAVHRVLHNEASVADALNEAVRQTEEILSSGR